MDPFSPKTVVKFAVLTPAVDRFLAGVFGFFPKLSYKSTRVDDAVVKSCLPVCYGPVGRKFYLKFKGMFGLSHGTRARMPGLNPMVTAQFNMLALATPLSRADFIK